MSGVLLAFATLALGGDQAPPLPAPDCAAPAGELQRADALAHYSLGEAYLAVERYPEALQAFFACRLAYRCSASPEESARAQRLLDEEIRELRYTIRVMERDRLLSGAIGFKEVNKDARIPMGESLRVIQDMENRLAELVAARRQDALEEPPELAFAVGNAYFHTNALADAAREFETALALRPHWGDAHNNLALVLMLTGRPRRCRAGGEARRKARRRGQPAPQGRDPQAPEAGSLRPAAPRRLSGAPGSHKLLG